MSADNPTTLYPWRALFWEPVYGTGERLMVGVVYGYHGTWSTARVIRDDVLASLYGKASAGAKRLIDFGLDMYREAAQAGQSLDQLDTPMAGLHPSPLRETEARSIPELLRVAALLYSSLANLDRIDEVDEADQATANEEATRQFGTSVRDEVKHLRPDLEPCFGRTMPLVQGGGSVKFGFASTRLLAHFNVLHPTRQGPSMNDARARIFALERGKTLSHLPCAMLLSGIPFEDDVTLGEKQHISLRKMRHELATEAESVGVLFRTADSPSSGAQTLISAEEDFGRE